ncbi:hypothetical protein DVH24_031404 [Malus domestica]|uniref:Uncharacterized protein n=1 Tax=Malus domestica TaxID=3750 RepID=A0A498HIV7_MALDO|nr:hypothetical protein DVH24_031404 [Malus domestica]
MRVFFPLHLPLPYANPPAAISFLHPIFFLPHLFVHGCLDWLIPSSESASLWLLSQSSLFSNEFEQQTLFQDGLVAHYPLCTMVALFVLVKLVFVIIYLLVTGVMYPMTPLEWFVLINEILRYRFLKKKGKASEPK